MSAKQEAYKPKRTLGVFTLAMISVSAIIALRNLPMMATQGWASLFFLGVASILFFIPVSLVSAELTSGWPVRGGVYAWVKEAFGEASGALAIWFEWIESVVWLPVVLSFIAASIAYVIDPELAQNRWFLLCTILAVLWATTFLNFFSIEKTNWLSTIGIIIGSIIPGLAVIGLALGWILAGNPLQVEFSMDALVPEMRIENFVILTEILLGFAGIEIAAYHVVEAKDPQRSYPKATLIAALTIIVIYVLGSLSIAIVVPKDQIMLHAGVMQAFEGFLGAFDLNWALPILALLAVVGALALTNTWIIGPSKGLLASALDDDLPEITKRTNKHGSPVVILLMQAIIATALALPYLFMPTVSSSYWLLNTLAAQLILLMYFMVFAAAIRLRYSEPETERAYKVPGGNLGMWIIGGTGAISCLVAFVLGFVPPEQFHFGDKLSYSLILLSGIILFSAPPFICQYVKFKKKGYRAGRLKRAMA